MRAPRVLGVLTLAAVACGLGLEGTGPDPSTTFLLDGGVPEASVDAAPAVSFCDAAKASDPTVRFCADFDDPAATSPFGFGEENTVPTGVFSLVPSPFAGTEPKSGALQVELLDASGSRTQRLRVKLTDLVAATPRRVIVDMDVAVASSTTLTYVLLGSIETLGQGCFVDYGVAAQADGLHAGDKVVAVARDAPVHVRLSGQLVRGKGSTFSATIGDTTVPDKTINVGSGCDTAWADVGVFYTSTENAHASARFDHVVVRVM